ncbi:unnamed protein product [Medioppia subpectinata]|uniref:glutathione transferase n=1 Tax=Medioppia subpectinata TaxID=1979941 RepID=A0A7R9LCN9_9ACAR|nr:unnamed protein product [Medioppia subpectinata]CAG2117361.1 unnamed protein product [Medioppia subpectinata]
MSYTTVPTLAYYKMRGLAQPMRLMLKYSDVKFNDKHYGNVDVDNVPEFRADWMKVKFTLGLDFPNLPYYMDGPIKVTQSNAIMRYLARKHGLVATDETGLVRQDMAEQQLVDIRYQFILGLVFATDFETVKVKYLAETLPKLLDELSRFLGTRQWFTGNEVNYVDFLAYEVLDWFRLFSPETVNKYQNLVQFLTRFESLPAIKAYMKSPEFISWPLLGGYAPWGYKK